MSSIDSINQSTWKASSSLRLYGKLDGYLGTVEAALFDRLAAQAKGGRVLDIGVGGGRTTSVITGFAGSYVGIDYTPEMIRLCRARFPDQRFIEMDARDMSSFEDASFDLVVFSFNGIDSVGPEGRMRILRECARVLVANGILFFSTFNRDGPGFKDRSNNREITLTPNPLRLAYSVAKYMAGGALGAARIIRYAHLEKRDREHAILLHKAHDFGILVYATTIPQIRAQLSAVGFVPDCDIIGSTGSLLTGDAAHADEYFYVIARKSPASR